MSKCISSEGEYSDHEIAEKPRFMCVRCFGFDEDAALKALERAEAKLSQVRAEAKAEALEEFADSYSDIYATSDMLKPLAPEEYWRGADDAIEHAIRKLRSHAAAYRTTNGEEQ